ncbi:ribosomal protein [Moniliophthora roreri]|nr:ribosomal protein [Moniliophthora roreri]
MAPRRRCPVCRSKQWHKEPSSGLIACSEGHILQNYRNETTEAEDLGQHSLKKRALKSDRKKKERASHANPKLYHGARARYLYFQCQQLILRKQIVALTKLCNLPSEFEMICREIWALHLSLLPDPPPAEPYYHAQREARAESEDPNPSLKHHSSPVPDKRVPSPDSYLSEGEDNKHRIRIGSGQSDSEEEDSEMAELLRQNSESEDDGDEEEDDGSTLKQAPKITRRRAYEGPANNLAVLMIACWTMRVPMLYRDFARYAELYELPYLDPVRYLPQEIVSHLTKHNIQALSPAASALDHVPSTVALHGLTSRLARLLYVNYGILTPEANAAPILWRVIDSIGGNPTLYCLTKRLSHILALPLALHHTLAPSLRIVKTSDPENHKYDDVPVEVSFMAATIIILKMVYGLDGSVRRPQESTDPACALPKLDEYLRFVGQLNEVSLSNEATIFSSVLTTSVGELRDEMIDDYLSFW